MMADWLTPASSAKREEGHTQHRFRILKNVFSDFLLVFGQFRAQPVDFIQYRHQILSSKRNKLFLSWALQFLNTYLLIYL
jgi:hypothetical protein